MILEVAVVYFILIFFSSFLQATSPGVVIDEPGIYFLNKDLIVQLGLSATSVISIQSDNVTLDLKDSSISQASPNNQPSMVGINVAANISHVAIRNGLIENLSGCGITIGDGCNDISIENMIVSRCHSGGIFLNGSVGITNCQINNCQVLSCTGSGGNSTFGLRITSGSGINILNSNFNSNDASLTSSGFGIQLTSCSNVKCINCGATDNGGNTLGAGFYVQSSNDCILENCNSFHNLARSNLAGTLSAGFYINQSNSIACFGCKAMNNTSQLLVGVGFELNSGTNNTLSECLSQGNRGATQAAGMRLTAQTNSVILGSRCIANVTTSSGTAYGIFLQGSSNHRCTLLDNLLYYNIGVGSSRALEDVRNPSTSVFSKNKAFNNGTTNYSISYPIGISLPLIVASLSNVLVGLPSLEIGKLNNVSITP